MSDNHNEAAEPQEISEENPRIYRSEAMRMNLGDFYFDKHMLKLTDPEKVREFEEILKQIAPGERRKIKTISFSAAESIIATHRAEAVSGSFTSSNALQEDVRNTQQLQTNEDLIRVGIDPATVIPEADDNLQATEKVVQPSLAELAAKK